MTMLRRPRLPAAEPDREAALAMYRRRAGIYDMELALFEPLRRRAVARLGLRPGDTVIDVGCGTGLSFALLREAIGAEGRIIGIEQSPEMIAKARERVEADVRGDLGSPARRKAVARVTLLTQPVETADVPGPADAALFHFTHDILRRPQAVANVLRHLRPGARVVACGLKWAPVLAWPTNLFVLPAALHSVTSFEGMSAPWNHLQRQLGRLDVSSLLLGGAYIASGAVAVRC
jgi:SAM-dependent methyltransferase